MLLFLHQEQDHRHLSLSSNIDVNVKHASNEGSEEKGQALAMKGLVATQIGFSNSKIENGISTSVKEDSLIAKLKTEYLLQSRKASF
jgi:hypothetical protein